MKKMRRRYNLRQIRANVPSQNGTSSGMLSADGEHSVSSSNFAISERRREWALALSSRARL
jgi:hypothetical protein